VRNSEPNAPRTGGVNTGSSSRSNASSASPSNVNVRPVSMPMSYSKIATRTEPGRCAGVVATRVWSSSRFAGTNVLPKIRAYGHEPKSPVTLTSVPPATGPRFGVMVCCVCATAVNAKRKRNGRTRVRIMV
jgi:hypothetical protein